MSSGNSGEAVKVVMVVRFDAAPPVDEALRGELAASVGELVGPIATGHVEINFSVSGETRGSGEPDLPDLVDDPRAGDTVYSILDPADAGRIGNALAREGLFKVRDILAMGRRELLDTRNFGQTAMGKIDRALGRHVPEVTIKDEPGARDYVRLYRDVADVPSRLIGSGELRRAAMVDTVGELLELGEAELRARIAAFHYRATDASWVELQQDFLLSGLDDFVQAFRAAKIDFRGE